MLFIKSKSCVHKVVLTVGNAPSTAGRNTSHLQADHGTLSVTGKTQGNTLTITDINSPSVTVSAHSATNGASMWIFDQAVVEGLGGVALTLIDTDEENVKTFTMPSSDVMISAEFEEKPLQPLQYAISYELNGGTLSTSNPISYDAESADIKLNNPIKTGYTFTGWTGTGIIEASTDVTIPSGSSGDRSYTANWQKITYKVSFDANCGEF